MTSDDKRKMIQIYTFQQAIVTTHVYRYLLLAGTFFVSLAHGSNDLGNAISPVNHLCHLVYKDFNGYWVFFMGSCTLVIGLIVYGQRTMSTIGSKIIKLDYMKGFVVCYSTGLSVAIGSIKGIPLSTTHCVVGAIGGIFVASKFSWVYRVYKLPNNPMDEEENLADDDINVVFASEQEPVESLKMNFDTIKEIVVWCLITVPSAFIFSAITAFIIK